MPNLCVAHNAAAPKNSSVLHRSVHLFPDDHFMPYVSVSRLIYSKFNSIFLSLSKSHPKGKRNEKFWER